jgi:hypothetical protein
VNKNISSICDLSNAALNGIAAGPYSGTFTEKILTFRNEPRKLAFSANSEIAIFSSKERVAGHIEGYDTNSEWNHCSLNSEFPGRGDFSSQFVAQYTAEIVTAEGSCKVSGTAKIIFGGAIRANVITPGSSFQAEILDSTACGDHTAGTEIGPRPGHLPGNAGKKDPATSHEDCSLYWSRSVPLAAKGERNTKRIL